MIPFGEFIKETPSPAMGNDKFESIAKKYGFTVKKLGGMNIYELYYNGKFAGLFDPQIGSEDLLNIYSRRAKKNL